MREAQPATGKRHSALWKHKVVSRGVVFGLCFEKLTLATEGRINYEGPKEDPCDSFESHQVAFSAGLRLEDRTLVTDVRWKFRHEDPHCPGRGHIWRCYGLPPGGTGLLLSSAWIPASYDKRQGHI